MAFVEEDLKDHLVPTVLLRTRLPITKSGTRSGCLGLHSNMEWTPLGTRLPQLLWVAYNPLSLKFPNMESKFPLFLSKMISFCLITIRPCKKLVSFLKSLKFLEVISSERLQ